MERSGTTVVWENYIKSTTIVDIKWKPSPKNVEKLAEAFPERFGKR